MIHSMVEGEILSWAEVQRTHRIRNGVYQRAGRLISLLTDFGRINPCYPDAHADISGETILYTGAGRRGDQHLTPPNRALLSAIESGHHVPLFNKLAPVAGNTWATGASRMPSIASMNGKTGCSGSSRSRK
jgi:hypothetical protein